MWYVCDRDLDDGVDNDQDNSPLVFNPIDINAGNIQPNQDNDDEGDVVTDIDTMSINDPITVFM